MFVSISPERKAEDLPKMLEEARKCYASLFGDKSFDDATPREVFLMLTLQIDIVLQGISANIERLAAKAYQQGFNDGLRKIAIPNGVRLS